MLYPGTLTEKNTVM